MMNPITIPSYYQMSETLDGWLPETADDTTIRLHKEAIKVLEDSRKDLEKIDAAKEAAAQDPNVTTPEAALVDTYRFQKKMLERTTNRSSSTENRLRSYQETIQQKIDSRIRNAAMNRHANEIRAYLRSLNEGDRTAFLQQAVTNKDIETVSAIIDSPAYLSGLDKETTQFYREQFTKSAFSEEQEMMDHLEKLADTIGRGFNAARYNVDQIYETPKIKRAIELRSKAKAAREEF